MHGGAPLPILLATLTVAGCSDTFRGDGGGDPSGRKPGEGEAPVVQILAPTGEGPWYRDHPIALVGQVDDADDPEGSLTARWVASNGDTLAEAAPDDDGRVAGEATLAEGDWTLTLEVADPSGNTGEASVALRVGGPNQPPSCGVDAPAPGTVAAAGETVELVGRADDPDVGPERLTGTWSSDLDGSLGSGALTAEGSLRVPVATLRAGTHRLAFTATDEAGASCEASAELVVGIRPSLSLDAPADGERVNEGERIAVLGVASDGDHTADALTITWLSRLDGSSGVGAIGRSGAVSFDIEGLAPGEHTLDVYATDPLGLSGMDSRTVVVNAVPTAPRVTLAPDPATTSDDLVVSAVDSIDPDGSGTVTYTYRWTEDGVPLAETGPTLSSAMTTKGRTYGVEVTPWDDLGAGLTGSDARTIANAAPVLVTTTLSATTVRVGDTVRCSAVATDVDAGDTVTIGYTWHDGSTGSDYTVTPADDPGATVTCVARAQDDDGARAEATASATVSNTDPVLSAVTVAPHEARVGDTVACSAVATDADGDTPSLRYAWSDGTTGATLTLTSAHPPGTAPTCTVYANDADGGTASGSASVTVLNTDPVVSVTITPDPAYNDDILTCLATASDPDGGAPSLAYRWVGETAGDIGTDDTIDLSGTGVASGESIRCEVTATDADAGSGSASATTVLGNRAPSVVASLTPGRPTVEDTLVCGAVAADPDDDATVTTFRWTVDGRATPASGTTASGSTLAGAFERGETVACTASTVDPGGASASETASVTIVNAAPRLTGVTLAPAVLRTADTASATYVAADSDGDSLTASWAWYVDGVLTATTSTLDGASTVAGFAKGQSVHAVLTVSDGADATSASSDVRTVANTPPSAPEVAIEPDGPVEGEALVCRVVTASTDADGDTVDYGVEWRVDGVAYGATADWIGPTTTVWTDDTVEGADTAAGEAWQCAVTPTDGDDAGDTVTAETTIQEACSVCGDGSDGAYAAAESGTIAGGVYETTTFTIPEGVTLTGTGSTPLVIYATESITIHGSLLARGENAVGDIGGAGVLGGMDGYNGRYIPLYTGRRYNGADGTHPTSHLLCSFSDPTLLDGGTGGEGGSYGRCSTSTACSCSATSAAGGGGGGGGAIALIAPVVTITGTIDVSGGRGAYKSCYWGGDGGDGTVWVHTGALAVTGSITRGALSTYTDLRLDAWSYTVPYTDYEYCPPLDMPRP